MDCNITKYDKKPKKKKKNNGLIKTYECRKWTCCKRDGGRVLFPRCCLMDTGYYKYRNTAGNGHQSIVSLYSNNNEGTTVRGLRDRTLRLRIGFRGGQKTGGKQGGVR